MLYVWFVRKLCGAYNLVIKKIIIKIQIVFKYTKFFKDDFKNKIN